MSVWSVLKSIGSVIGQAAGVASTVVRIAGPILQGLRNAIPEVGRLLGLVEKVKLKAETEGDDLLDRNLPAINALEQASARGIVVMTELNALAVALRVYSQEQTPDRLTPTEAADLGQRADRIFELVTQWGPELDKAIDLLAAADPDTAVAMASLRVPAPDTDDGDMGPG